jgi:outer membrane protein assembly factor BamB
MTDEQLIELLQNSSPDELTIEQIELLRSRLAESPDLQHTLSRQLQMDQYLSAALARVDISIDDVRGPIEPPSEQPPNSLLLGVGGVVSLLLVGFVVFVLYRAATDGDAAVKQVAQADRKADPTIDQETEPARKDPPSEPVVPPVEPEPEPDEPIPDEPPSEPEPPAEAKLPEGPWSSPDQLGGPVVAWDEIALDGFLARDSRTNWEESPQWFTSAQGLGHQVKVDKHQAELRGTGRLKAPWPADAVLRMSLSYEDEVAIYFWTGETGAAMVFYPPRADRGMTGYVAQRKGGQPRPNHLELASSDQGRDWRTGRRDNSKYTTIDYRWQDGELLVSRGNVRLLAIPLSEPPTEVIVDALNDQFKLREIRMFHSTPLPEEPGSEAKYVSETAEPATLEWREKLPEGARVERLDDGRLRLVSSKDADFACLTTPLPATGACEYLFEVEGASPGTGVWLTTTEQDSVPAPRFIHDSRQDQSFIRIHNATDSERQADILVHREPAAYAGERTWIRLICGMGMLKCWTSPDGIHWGQVADPVAYGINKPLVAMGLYSARTDNDRAITLRSLRVREFAALNSLTSPELLAAAPVVFVPDWVNWGVWHEAVAASLPEGADLDSWRTACALRTLGSGMGGRLAGQLALRLLRDAANSDRPIEDRQQIIAELLEWGNLYQDGDSALNWPEVASVYEKMGTRILQDGAQRPFTDAGPRWFSMPAWMRYPYPKLADELLRAECINLVNRGDWDALRRLVNDMELADSSGLKPLAEWAGGLADAELPGRRGERTEAFDFRWRHPLNIELSKEGFNVLAELDVALSSEAYRDACEIITSVDASDSFGLLPAGADANLWVSLPVAVSAAMRRRPDLLRTMREEFGPLGRLRVREAISAGDAETLEAAIVQFYGTEAAAEAHQWLGDRALSAGDFTRALGSYSDALRNAPPSLGSGLAARQRLAGSMLGQAVGDPVTGPVRLGDTELSAAEFEAIIADMLKHRTATAASTNQGATRHNDSAAPPARLYQTHGRARLDGPAGRNPNHVPGEYQQYRIDWVARQLGVAQDTSRFYVSNRFQVAAYDLNSGQRRWQANIGDGKVDAHHWRLTPMRPVVAGGRVLARRLNERGPSLVCLNSENGQKVWEAESRQGEELVSDPLVVGGEALVLVAREFGRQMVLSLAAYEMETGELLRRTAVGRFGQSWRQYQSCGIALVGDTIVATLGGSVLCVELDGAPRWMRKQTWLSTYQSPQWMRQHSPSPIARAGRLYVMQPGVPALECIEAGSGRLVWSRLLPTVHRIVGFVGDRLIVEAGDSLLALDAATGEIHWRHEIDEPLEASWCGEPGGVVYSRKAASQHNGQFHPELVWLDPNTGKATARTELNDLHDADPRFASLVVHENHVWALFGRGPQDPNRDIVELAARSEPAAAVAGKQPVSRWLANVDSELHQATAQVLPDWTMLSGHHDEKTGLIDEYRGQKQVLATDPSHGHAKMRLARQVKIPQGGRPQLRIYAACQPAGEAIVDVVADGREIWKEHIKGSETGGNWKEYRVDLSSLAGKTVWLFVRQHDFGNHQAQMFWKRLEIAF